MLPFLNSEEFLLRFRAMLLDIPGNVQEDCGKCTINFGGSY